MPNGLQLAVGLALLALPAAADDDPSVRIRDLLTAGKASYLKTDYETARKSYNEAWEYALTTDPKNPLRYEVLKRLSGIESALGNYAAAENWLQQAITFREVAFGSGDDQFLSDMLDASALCRAMKDYDRAIAIIERVMYLHVRSDGPKSAPVAGDLQRIAQIHMDRKEAEKAAVSLENALEILIAVKGEDAADLIPVLDRLGEIRIALRAYEDAERIYRRALAIRERLFGRDSADLLQTLDGLAYSCFGQKKYDVAEPLYQRLIALWITSAGKDHPMVAITYDKIAVFYAEQEKFDKAQEAGAASTALRAQFMAVGLAREAVVKLQQNKFDDARALYQRALAVLDPPRPEHEEIRKQLEGNLKLLEPAPVPKPAAPAKKRK